MPLINIGAPKYLLPDVLFFDANVLLKLSKISAKPTNPEQQALVSFLKRVRLQIKAGTLHCVAPINTLEECYFQVIKSYYLQGQPTGTNFNKLYKANPNLINSCMPRIRNFQAAVQAFPIEILEPEELGTSPPSIDNLLIQYIDEMHLLPNDAHLLAVAQRLNTPHIATLDRDFERASSRGFYIYTYVP
jgi:hypothetical protein